MIPFKKGLILLLLPLFAFTSMHKFYVSVTHVDYSEKDHSLQLTSRIFTDDLEKMLRQRYKLEPHLQSRKELPDIDTYIERYLKQHLTVKLDQKTVPIHFLGREYENDVVKCYIEIKNVDISSIRSIEIQNSILFDIFDDQNNIIHFKVLDLRKSFSLTEGNDKALLKFNIRS